MTEETPKRGRLSVIKREPPPVNAEVVDMLRDWLSRAERGEIIEFAAVCVTNELFGHSERTAIDYTTVMLGELKLLADEISEASRNAEDD